MQNKIQKCACYYIGITAIIVISSILNQVIRYFLFKNRLGTFISLQSVLTVIRYWCSEYNSIINVSLVKPICIDESNDHAERYEIDESK